MSHQPFENWIMDREQLDSEHEIELAEHMNHCEKCTLLKSNLLAFEAQIRDSSPVGVPDGFSQRWQKSFESRRANQHRKQSRQVAVAFVAASVIVLLALSIYIVIQVNPLDLVAGAIKAFAGMVTTFSRISSILDLLSGSPAALPIVIVASLLALTTIGILGVAWMTVFWRYSLKGLTTK